MSDLNTPLTFTAVADSVMQISIHGTMSGIELNMNGSGWNTPTELTEHNPLYYITLSAGQYFQIRNTTNTLNSIYTYMHFQNR